MSLHARQPSSAAPDMPAPAEAGSSLDPLTLAHYEARAQVYAERISRSLPDGDLTTFMQALPPSREPVLDWGCGPGNTSALLEAHGIACIATDASPAMARLAEGLGVRVRVEPFEALAPVPRFRGIWSNFSLMHIPRPMFAPLVARAAAALLPGGVLHVGLDTAIGRGRGDIVREARIDGALMTFFRPAEILAAIRTAGLLPVSARSGQGRTVDGTPTDFHILLARKPA